MKPLQFKALATPGTDELYLYGEVGYEITAAQVAEALKTATAPELIVRVNSPGGSVFEGQAIYNLLRSHASKAKITVMVDGLAASIASVITCAGDSVHMPDNAFLMIHNPVGGVFGDSADMAQMAEIMGKIRDTIAGIYAKKTGKPVEEIIPLMDAETWFTAQEALALGLIDVIDGAVEIAAHYDLSRFTKAPQALALVPVPPAPQKPAPEGKDSDLRATCKMIFGTETPDFTTEIANRAATLSEGRIKTILAALSIKLDTALPDVDSIAALITDRIEKQASAMACQIVAKQGADAPVGVGAADEFGKKPTHGLTGLDRINALTKRN